jgi:peroxiredoxin
MVACDMKGSSRVSHLCRESFCKCAFVGDGSSDSVSDLVMLSKYIVEMQNKLICSISVWECRYAAFVEDGRIKVLNVEKVPSEFKVSDAETLIKSL